METFEKSTYNPSHAIIDNPEDTVDLRDTFRRLNRGLEQIIGLALIGMVIAAVVCLIGRIHTPIPTSTRVVFSFPGFERGEYPDRTKFQADDLCAPNIIEQALQRQGIKNAEAMQGKIRESLNIEGIIPTEVIKEHDRLRATGQNPPPYIPNEYTVVLTLPHDFPLDDQQRGMLLHNIIITYRENFQRTYADLPTNFGNAFASLRNADFPDYELILSREMQNIITYLNGRINDAGSSVFRSPSTNLSFNDLLEQSRFFSEVQLNRVLGLIYLSGLSRSRADALAKMDYQLRLLADQENRALEEQTVVQDLLAKAQERSQNYILGIKSQITQARGETPILDQGLIDSLLANDAYNFLVRRALDAGLRVKDIQADEAALSERHKRMESLPQQDDKKEAILAAQAQKALAELELNYLALIDNIRKTNADFAHQQYGDAVRLSAEITTEGAASPLAIACAIGVFLGLAGGLGMSLLGVYIGPAKEKSKS